MNESLGANPAEVLNARLQLPVPDTLDNIDDPDNESEPPLKPRREGLPPNFGMRHDRHYVEELMSTPTSTQGVAYVTSPRPSVAAAATPLVDDHRTSPDTPPRPSAAAVDLIASRLESIVAHGAIARGPAASTDLVGRTVQAELQRVSRFARAVAVSGRQIEPVRRTVSAGEIAAAIRSACTRVARLNGMDCVVTTDDAGFALALERGLVVQSIAGTIDALLDLAHTNADDEAADEGGRIAVSLQAARVRPALIVDVECPTLAWRVAPADRFFENSDQDFAAAPAAGILLASAAHVVRLHGGRVEVQLQDGVSVRYVFPQEPPRATTAS
ncbi:MAG: hypothetical protein ACRD1V_05355 [Vicinamibacterales bacterium]